ncbi:MAG: type II CAAX endopeptidase family protein [Chloroflexota bacterium]
MKELWSMMPVWLRAILVGVVLLYPPLILTAIPIDLNIELILPSIPWSFPVIVALLWLFWRFTTGQPKPFNRSAERTRLSRHNEVKTENLSWIAAASVALLIMTYSLMQVGVLLGNFEDLAMAKRIGVFNQVQPYMAIFLFLGISLSAGVIEEIAFRGYLQTMLTENYGVFVSFLLIAILFWLAHGLPLLLAIPFMLVSIGYSLLAESCDAIMPVIVTHVVIDFVIYLLGYLGLIYTLEHIAYSVFTDGINISFITYLAIAIVSAIVIWFACRVKLRGMQVANG